MMNKKSGAYCALMHKNHETFVHRSAYCALDQVHIVHLIGAYCAPDIRIKRINKKNKTTTGLFFLFLTSKATAKIREIVTMTKQSRQDRLLRLSDGRCPIHGCSMGQVRVEWMRLPCGCMDTGRSIIECPRKDCSITAFDDNTLFPEFQYLLEENKND